MVIEVPPNICIYVMNSRQSRAYAHAFETSQLATRTVIIFPRVSALLKCRLLASSILHFLWMVAVCLLSSQYELGDSLSCFLLAMINIYKWTVQLYRGVLNLLGLSSRPSVPWASSITIPSTSPVKRITPMFASTRMSYRVSSRMLLPPLSGALFLITISGVTWLSIVPPMLPCQAPRYPRFLSWLVYKVTPQ